MNTTTLMMMLFNGLVFGSYLVLLSLGLSIIFGMLGVVNFAQGALYMLGAYAGYTCLLFGLNFWVALLVAPLVWRLSQCWPKGSSFGFSIKKRIFMWCYSLSV